MEEKINTLEQQTRKHDKEIKMITIIVLLLSIATFLVSINLGRAINDLESSKYHRNYF